MIESTPVFTPRTAGFSLLLPAEEDSVGKLANRVSKFSEEQGWPMETAMHVDLVLEELVMNVVSYGYPDGRNGQIGVDLSQDAQGITIVVEDDGDAYDPFVAEAPDLTMSLEERQIGGLGVHFVRQFTDNHRYQRVGNRNRVELIKLWAGKSESD